MSAKPVRRCRRRSPAASGGCRAIGRAGWNARTARTSAAIEHRQDDAGGVSRAEDEREDHHVHQAHARKSGLGDADAERAPRRRASTAPDSRGWHHRSPGRLHRERGLMRNVILGMAASRDVVHAGCRHTVGPAGGAQATGHTSIATRAVRATSPSTKSTRPTSRGCSRPGPSRRSLRRRQAPALDRPAAPAARVAAGAAPAVVWARRWCPSS